MQPLAIPTVFVALRVALGPPVVPIVASRGQGLEALEAAIRQSLESHPQASPDAVDHGPDLEAAIADLSG